MRRGGNRSAAWFAFDPRLAIRKTNRIREYDRFLPRPRSRGIAISPPGSSREIPISFRDSVARKVLLDIFSIYFPVLARGKSASRNFNGHLEKLKNWN